MALQYGRRPPKKAQALDFGHFRAPRAPRATPVPAHPRSVDYLATLSGWQMLGNDVAGDCNAVTWANMRRLVTSTLTTESYPGQAEVWQFYRTQNPRFDPAGTATTDGPGSSADGGMDIQTGLEYLHSTGGPDGVKVVAFATVDHTNLAEVEAALAVFGCLWLGISVQQANQTEFSEGKPWTKVAGSPVEGGHAVLGGGYTPDVRFITWARETEFTPSFWKGSVDGTALVEEAWIAIWPEHLGTREFEQGINVPQLRADYQELTGTPLVLP